MRTLSIKTFALALLAATGAAFAAPAGAEVIYQSAPTATVVTPSYTTGAQAYVYAPPPVRSYSYDNGSYGYHQETYANGCHVTRIREFGQTMVSRNCY
jgi:hypothetical protein